MGPTAGGRRKVCGVLADRLHRQSLLLTGQASGVKAGSGGWAHLQLTGPAQGGVAVVIQGRENRSHGEAVEICGCDAGDTAARASDLTGPLGGVGWPTI